MSLKILVTCRIDKDVRDRLKRIAEKLDINFSEAFRMALKINSLKLNFDIQKNKGL